MKKKYICEELRVAPEYTKKTLCNKIAKRTGISKRFLENVEVLRRSIDARKGLFYVLTVSFSVHTEYRRDLSFLKVHKPPAHAAVLPDCSGGGRIIIIGAGPAGLFAALEAARAGLSPIIFERGEAVEKRSAQVARFWKDGRLNEESNMLFGEGGAGLFSDGKLTSRSKNREEVRAVLQTFIDAGAPADIMIDTHPHLGTDRLVSLVPALRKRIQALGGEFRFGEAVTAVLRRNDRFAGVRTAAGEYLAHYCICAAGHSAHDLYESLYECGIAMRPKGFAAGVRMELPQASVNRALYGVSDPVVGAAEFRLRRRLRGMERSVYSFCMCPGGVVVSCASRAGGLTTNGMSYAARDLPRANAAFLVPLQPKDFGGSDAAPLAGLVFQRQMEKAAFAAGGSTYALPGDTLAGFLGQPVTGELPADASPFQVRRTDIRPILPDLVRRALEQTLPDFARKLGVRDFTDVCV
ncbi:MAG: NAD(P)/FAD-dependent oxidoreductase, partial [Fibrobacterota bacterium]